MSDNFNQNPTNNTNDTIEKIPQNLQNANAQPMASVTNTAVNGSDTAFSAPLVQNANLPKTQNDNNLQNANQNLPKNTYNTNLYGNAYTAVPIINPQPQINNPYLQAPSADLQQMYLNNMMAKNRKFTKIDTVFSLLSFIMGYLFVKLIITGGLGIGVTINFLAVVIYAVLYSKFKGINLSGSSVTSFTVIGIFSVQFFLSANVILKVLNLVFLIIYFIFTCTNLKRTSKNFWSDNFIARFFHFGFCEASDEIPSGFLALSRRNNPSKEEHRNGSGNLKYIALGLIIALPVCFVIIFMLCSADEIFYKIINYLFSGFFKKILNNALMFVTGIPIALYLFALLFSATSKKSGENNEVYTDNNKHHVIPSSAVLSFSIPIILVYFTFFFSQMPYFLSAFSKWLPENFSYAQYARRGFFELSAVIIINLIIIFIITYFCKLKENGIVPCTIKTITSVLSVITLLLIATVLSKMIMYIDNYGLTRLRVYVSWFMILTAISFLLIFIKQFISSFNLARGIFSVFVVMFFILCFSNIDGHIAKYNIERYNENTLQEIDVSMMTRELSPACIEHILPLLTDEKISEYDKKDILRYVFNFKTKYEEASIRSYNIEEYFAYKAILEFENKYGKMNLKYNEYYSDYSDYSYYSGSSDFGMGSKSRF